MSDGTVLRGCGIPRFAGLYAVEVFSGWRVLELRDGSWWFPQCTARWGADVPAQWVGPLPKTQYVEKAAPPVFDL